MALIKEETFVKNTVEIMVSEFLTGLLDLNNKEFNSIDDFISFYSTLDINKKSELIMDKIKKEEEKKFPVADPEELDLLKAAHVNCDHKVQLSKYTWINESERGTNYRYICMSCCWRSETLVKKRELSADK